MASIDGHRLRRFNDMYFNVSDVVSNMDDDGVRKALYGSGGGDALRGRLLQKMLRPYTPSFMLPENKVAKESKPVVGLLPETAEGIMQAIERKLVTHDQWLAVHPLWHNILATSKQYRP
jgi:hypothetical protein